VFLALLVILAINVAVYGLKVWMKDCDFLFLRDNYNAVFSAVLAVSISIINSSYVSIAERLAEFENHRTDTQYRDSKIVKLFVVQMISSFGGLAYVAYLEAAVEGSCGEMSCMGLLSSMVSTILVERFLYTMVFDNIFPRITVRSELAPSLTNLHLAYGDPFCSGTPPAQERNSRR